MLRSSFQIILSIHCLRLVSEDNPNSFAVTQKNEGKIASKEWELLRNKLSTLDSFPELADKTKPLIVYIILSRLGKIEYIRDIVRNLGIEEIDNNRILLRGNISSKIH